MKHRYGHQSDLKEIDSPNLYPNKKIGLVCQFIKDP